MKGRLAPGSECRAPDRHLAPDRSPLGREVNRRMPRFRIHDVNTIEHAPTSPAALRNKLSEMIMSSVNARAKVELINPETGEYRIVLQGTIDKEETKFDAGI